MTISIQVRPHIKELREWRLAHNMKQTDLGNLLSYGHSCISHIECLRQNPSDNQAEEIARITGISLELLFPPWQRLLVSEHYFHPVQINLTNEFLHSQAEMLYALNQSDSHPNENLDALKETMSTALATLTPREQRVIRLRFGFYEGTEQTREQVAQEFTVSRERIRQLEAKALKKLRHPQRSRMLQEYL